MGSDRIGAKEPWITGSSPVKTNFRRRSTPIRQPVLLNRTAGSLSTHQRNRLETVSLRRDRRHRHPLEDPKKTGMWLEFEPDHLQPRHRSSRNYHNRIVQSHIRRVQDMRLKESWMPDLDQIKQEDQGGARPARSGGSPRGGRAIPPTGSAAAATTLTALPDCCSRARARR
jgi:hypothetical protein